MVALLALLSGVAQANGGYDYPLPDVEWHTLETEHFYFHWPESTKPKDDPHWFTTEWSAGQLATIAEDAYPKICGQFDYYPKEKVHVVVYDQGPGWEGNGFALAEYDVTGFAADWGPLFRERGRAEFLADVFVHEFAHIVSLKAYLPFSEDMTGLGIGGLSEDEEWLRRWGAVNGPLKRSANVDLAFDVSLTAHTPFWWAEGGAEYWSHQAGTNFWGSSRDAFLRTTVLEGRVPSRAEWTTRMQAEGFEGERGYNHGYAFSQWLTNERFPDKDVVSEMAAVSHGRWHWSWDKVVQEATGVPMSQLHDEWLAHLDTYYGDQKARIEADRVVTGKELALSQPAYEDPDSGFDDWKWKHQKAALDQAGSAWHQTGNVHPNGQVFAWYDDALNVAVMGAGDWGAISGTYIPDDWKDAKAWYGEHPMGMAPAVDWMRPDFSPTEDRILFVGTERDPPAALAAAGLDVVGSGYDWKTLQTCTWTANKRRLDLDCEAVPNTLRAREGAFHPNGSTIAFVRYADGTQNLWTVELDGSDAKPLTTFADGTQFNGVDWSADGRFLLVGMHRNFRQDAWLLEVATGEWTRLTDSEADELDPIFGPEGRVWFASDAVVGSAPKKFDVFSMDIESREVRRHTNVYGSVFAPVVSPEGHLFYTGFTGHGYRNFGVNVAELDQRIVDYPGACAVDGCDPAAEFAGEPVAIDVKDRSSRFNPVKSAHPLMGWPTLRISDKNVEVGAGIFTGDHLEKHMLSADFSVGKDTYIGGSYTNMMFWPNLTIGYGRYSFKSAYGLGDDADGLPQTTDDKSVVDVKYEQVSDDFFLYGDRYINDTLWVSMGVDASRYSFRESGDGTDWGEYIWNSGVGITASWDASGWGQDGWVNPRGGRRLTVDYQLRRSQIVDPETAGAVYDDGELLEGYTYNRLEVNYTEFIPFFERHTLQLDVTAGFIDRNVMGWDEFSAGGRHPYDWGSGSIGNNSQFAGYEGWSLNGETMLIGNASYRFPLARDLNLKMGPIYTESMYLQVFGTAGNLWSYRVDGPSHVEGYSVVPSAGGSVKREVPFADYSSKNSIVGRRNFLLTDVGVELRVRQFLWNDWDWDSFVKVAYGFQPTAGYGDVNSDGIQSSVARDAASELSSELEPGTIRVYAGLGTGW